MYKEHKDSTEISITDLIRNIKNKEHTDKITMIFELSIVYSYLYKRKVKLLNMFSNKDKRGVSIAENEFVKSWHREHNILRDEFGHIIKKNKKDIEDSKLQAINFHGDDIGKKTLAMHLMCERFRKHKYPS